MNDSCWSFPHFSSLHTHSHTHKHIHTDCHLTLGENYSMTVNQFLIADSFSGCKLYASLLRVSMCTCMFLSVGVFVCLVYWGLCYGKPAATLLHLVAKILMLIVWIISHVHSWKTASLLCSLLLMVLNEKSILWIPQMLLRILVNLL